HIVLYYFFFSSRRRHTRCLSDWSSDVCSSDLVAHAPARRVRDHAHRIEVLPRRAGGDHDLLPQPRRALLEQPRRGGEHRLRLARSEERRVGKEWRCRWVVGSYKKECEWTSVSV